MVLAFYNNWRSACLRRVLSRAIFEAPTIVPFRIPDRRYGNNDLDRTAFLMDPHGLIVFDALTGMNASKNKVFLVLTVIRDELTDRPPHHLLGTVAKKLGRRLIPARDGSVGGLADNGVEG